MSDARFRFVGPALAGAALIGVALFLARGSEADPESVDRSADRTSAVADPLEILEPIGTVSRWSLFRWLGEAPRDCRFRIRIWNGGWDESAPVVQQLLDHPFWTPSDLQLVELTEELRWEIAVVDDEGKVLTSTEASARLEERIADAERDGDDDERSDVEEDEPTPIDLDPWYERSLQAEKPDAEVSDAFLEALRTEFAHILEAWGSTKDRPGETAFLLHTRRRSALNTLFHLEAKHTASEASRLRALAHLYAVQTSDVQGEVPTIERARDLLTRDGSLVLAFVPGRRRISVLGFDAKSSFYASLPLEREYERTRRALQTAIAAPPTGELAPEDTEFLGAASELSTLLLPPELAEHLQGKRHLYVIGVDLLGYVPFELLPLPSGQRLEELVAISYVDSLPRAAQTLARPRDESWARELGLLIAAPLDEERRERWPGLEPIPHHRADLELLHSGLRPSQVESLEGRAGDRFALARLAGNARMLHLVVHGLRLTEERDPVLLVATLPWDDGVLELEDLAEIRMPSLVRLSIAGTDEEGWDGGAAARTATTLLAAGSDVVLVPPRALDVLHVERVTPALHRDLLEDGLSVAEAVRRARALARESGASLPTGLVHVYGAGSRPLR